MPEITITEWDELFKFKVGDRVSLHELPAIVVMRVLSQCDGGTCRMYTVSWLNDGKHSWNRAYATELGDHSPENDKKVKGLDVGGVPLGTEVARNVIDCKHVELGFGGIVQRKFGHGGYDGKAHCVSETWVKAKMKEDEERARDRES